MKENIFITIAVRACVVSMALIISPNANAQPTNFARSLSELRAQIDAHVSQPRFSGSLWGIKVASLATGITIYEHHADRLMSPASNSKLYAGALALSALGGDYRMVTRLRATSSPDADGILRGDLIVSGSGDPSWKGTNFDRVFSPFIIALTNAGVRRVTGDLVADTTFFRGPANGGSWSVEDLNDSEGAEISALTLNDNLTQVSVTPGSKVSAPGEINLLLPHTGLLLVNRTRTTTRNGQSHLEMWRAPGTKKLFVFGQVPLGSAAETLDVPVPEPSLWFCEMLKAACAEQGIAIEGKVRCLAWPELPSWPETNLTILAEVKSPPLRELVRAFMKPSQNLETDLVFDHVGESLRAANAPSWQTSEQSAVVALEKFLAAQNVPADLHFDEGSGLSRNNLTSANATVALLAAMAKSRSAQDFFDALPVAGMDGTIRRRMKNTPAFQNVHAKTGTLRWVNALSGHVTTAAGDKLIFSLMLNRYVPPADRKRTDELDDIAVMLAGFQGRLEE